MEKGEDEDHKENARRSFDKPDGNETAKAVPLGLGLGGLERKVNQFCIFLSLVNLHIILMEIY